MQKGYFSTAFNDLKNSPKWVGKMFLLALVGLIPIFGQMVIYGYFYGWARDIAWGVHAPLPKRIFGNEDGKLYSRGFYILVLTIVLALIPGVIIGIANIVGGLGVASVVSTSRPNSSSYAAIGVFGFISIIIMIIGYIAMFIIMFFEWVGSMRISIYGQLSAGFQLKKSWAMMRKDSGGILRIFGMYLLMGVVLGVILSIIIMIFSVIFGIVGGFALVDVLSYSSSRYYSSVNWGLVAAAIVVGILLFIIFMYIAYVLSMMVMAVLTRALGYWTRQFDVPAWRGKNDPMPFEVQAQQSAAQVPYAPPAAQAPPVAQPPVGQAPVAPVTQQPVASASEAAPTAPVVQATAPVAAQEGTPVAQQPVVSPPEAAAPTAQADPVVFQEAPVIPAAETPVVAQSETAPVAAEATAPAQEAPVAPAAVETPAPTQTAPAQEVPVTPPAGTIAQVAEAPVSAEEPPVTPAPADAVPASEEKDKPQE